MKLRVGLVGLGEAWQTRHRPALRALSDRFEVRAVHDQVSQRAQRVAADFQAAVVDGFRSLVAREDIDAVLMLACQWYGSLPILAASDAGKAVYCGVAMDLTLRQALEMKRRVERSGIAFLAEFPRRVAPATIRLKELIATRLGHPRLLFCHQRLPSVSRSAHGYSSHGQETQQQEMARRLMELVDWCHYIVGTPPTSVVGVRHPGAADRGGYQMMSLEFAPPGPDQPAPLAQISCGTDLPAGWQEALSFRPPAALQVTCDRGQAFVDLPSSLVWFDEAGRHMESLETDRPADEQLLLQFHRAVTSLVHRRTNLEDAYTALSVLLAAEQSACQGRRMLLHSTTG
jgi:predicted dehydrogenase